MKKRGFALVSLISIVIVLIILIAGVTIGGSSILIRSRKLKFANEILQIEKLTKDYEIRKNGSLDFEIVNYDLDTMTDENKKSYLLNEADNNNDVELYVVDLSKIDAVQTIRGTESDSENDRYLYSTITKKVYYDKGVDIGGSIYFGINDEIESMLK